MKSIKNLCTTIICIFTIIIMTACTQDSADNRLMDPLDEKIMTMELLQNGEVVVLANENAVYGSVQTQLNEESEIYKIEFYDENGDLLNQDALEYKLSWQNNSDLVAFINHAKWEFCVLGKKAGNATFQISIENETNEVYSSPTIPLNVEQ